MICTTPYPYAQYSHNSQKALPKGAREKAFTRILRILRFSPFPNVTAALRGLVASHVSVPRKRLLCEAKQHVILPAVA